MIGPYRPGGLRNLPDPGAQGESGSEGESAVNRQDIQDLICIHHFSPDAEVELLSLERLIRYPLG